MVIANSKFEKVVPNTAKDKKILSFSKKSECCKQEIYKNNHIIDIHVNTEVDYWAGDTLGDETSTSSGIDPVM